MWSVRAIVLTIAIVTAFGLSVGPASAGYLAPTPPLVGAEAARQSSDPTDSRIMHEHALHDSSAAVRAKMLENAAIPLLDGSANAADRSLVRSAIAAGLRDASADVNAEALAGDMFVRRGHADDVLRRFAVSGDPLRRAAARLAMLHSMFRSRYAVHMIEAGFTDPDARVRFAATDAFQQPTPTAIARVKIMAAHAPTKAERDFARSQLQPSGW